MRFQGEVAVVTGASRGLGREVARALAREGAAVVAVARGRRDLERAVAAIRRDGGVAFAVRGDVGAADPETIVGRAAGLAGTPTLFVNCASTLGPVPLRLLLDLSDADACHVFQVNALGPLALARRLVGPMVLAGRGTVAFVSSDAAVEAYPRWGAYGASKAALDHLGRVLAAELDGTGVRVFSVDPGEMDTRMHSDAIPDADRATLARPESVAERILDLLATPSLAASGSRVQATRAA